MGRHSSRRASKRVRSLIHRSSQSDGAFDSAGTYKSETTRVATRNGVPIGTLVPSSYMIDSYIFAITASPNSLHFTSFAPSIWRAKSYVTVAGRKDEG